MVEVAYLALQCSTSSRVGHIAMVHNKERRPCKRPQLSLTSCARELVSTTINAFFGTAGTKFRLSKGCLV